MSDGASVQKYPLQKWTSRCVKRGIDIILSLIAILFSPLWFIPLAIAVKLSSRGPVLFRQRRTGYKGREFCCLKFRTMQLNDEADELQAYSGDTRITKVGHFLRKTSLDELPQVFNILWGDMSIVGPRPHMIKHTVYYSTLIDNYMLRHLAKPGLTGLAQVCGYRGETRNLWQMEKRVDYDVKYIEKWSIWQDFKIIARTFLSIFKHDANAI